MPSNSTIFCQLIQSPTWWLFYILPPFSLSTDGLPISLRKQKPLDNNRIPHSSTIRYTQQPSYLSTYTPCLSSCCVDKLSMHPPYTNLPSQSLDCNPFTYTYNPAPAPTVVSSLRRFIWFFISIESFLSAYEQALIFLIIKKHSLDFTSPSSQLLPHLCFPYSKTFRKSCLYVLSLFFLHSLT